MAEGEQLWKANCSTKYDAVLEKIPGLIHLPWVGTEYDHSQRRILIVGDSHYDSDEEEGLSIYFTRGIINCCIDLKVSESWNMQRNLMITFGVEEDNAKAFWRSIAFCNIVQEVMPESDTPPTEEQYIKGGQILREIINILKPTDCIIVGVRCERNLALRKWEREGILDFQWGQRINGTYPFFGTFAYPNGEKIPIVNIKHTSQGYNPEQWSEFLRYHMPEACSFLSGIH